MKILVIGGGITGPTLALALKRAGHDVEIFDRMHGPDPTAADADNLAASTVDVGGGLTLMENGLRVFRRLGLLDRIVAAGTPCDRYDMCKINGDLVASFPVHNKEDLVTVNILRSAITRTVYAALRDEGVRIQTGKQLVAIDQTDDGVGSVTATFKDGTSARGDILVGADGVHSAVRRLLFPQPERQPFKSGFVGYLGVGEYRAEYDWPSKALHFFTDNVAGKSGMLMRASETEVHWALYETRAEDVSHDDWQPLYDLDAESARLAALTEKWGLNASFVKMVRGSSRIIPLTIYDLHTLPEWHRGNCVLVGDAAHAMVPFLGQGSSIALEDTDVLAKLLARFPADPRTAFALYQEARYERAKAVAEGARLQGQRQYDMSPVGAVIGHVVLRVFAFVAWATGGNLSSEQVLGYDGHQAVDALLKKKGYSLE
ncbi:hypothetical protein DFJ73DRAFT_963046 [Zopfochytrium polystomum]|nr:hypothetical protein DFJ73DRAFT_963046 [Zopfochytrium polystomum]